MNLNKLKLLVLLLPAMALSGCEEWKADQALVENIWKKTVEVTSLPAETPMPRVEFLPVYDPKKERALGRCYYGGNDGRLEIYLKGIVSNIWKCRDRGGWNISYKEGEVITYAVMAHEMLHHALFLKGVTVYRQHKAMQELGYMEKMVDFISQCFQIHPDGYQKEFTLKGLGAGVRKDEKSLAGN